jgi:hypothetical protein
MLLTFLLVALAADWVPMRWSAADPAGLKVLKDTPINCLLLEKAAIRQDVVAAAAKIGIDSLVVLGPGTSEANLRKAAALKAKGVVFEGLFERGVLETLHNSATSHELTFVDLLPRAQLLLDNSPAVLGTFQGIWPGIQIEEKGSAKAAPSGAPWINTNSGFLRFLRSTTTAPVWIGVRPPTHTVITPQRYLQAVSDAAMVGARWVVALDDDLSRSLLADEEPARKLWQRMTELLRFYESHPDWRDMKPAGQLAIVQDVESGALLSGGVLDMIAVKHTPVRPVPTRKLQTDAMTDVKMAVNVAPDSLSEDQKVALRAWARSGGTLLSAPSTLKFPAPQGDRITLNDEEVQILDVIWKEVNNMTVRRNLGVRLFNVSSMLSNLLQSKDGRRTLLHLANYSGYPVENITVHLLGKFQSARLLAPGAAESKLELYEVDGGSGIDIANLQTAATLILE